MTIRKVLAFGHEDLMLQAKNIKYTGILLFYC